MTTRPHDLASAYEAVADASARRARRMREQAGDLDVAMSPLRAAMARRAAELELTSEALRHVAAGQVGVPLAA